MSPLHSFLFITEAFIKKPYSFWNEQNQKQLLDDSKMAIRKLKKMLEEKKLETTMAYKTLVLLGKSFTQDAFDEASFLKHLVALLELYRKTLADKNTMELIIDIYQKASKAREAITEYHLALEFLEQEAAELTEKERHARDLKTIQDVGIFYVLEYTLQVLYEWPQLSEEKRTNLLQEGLQTKAGNLPAYLPLEDTFRNELCLKIFDPKLRNSLLQAFYIFEEIMYNDADKFASALKKFNLELLELFKTKGLTQFKGLVYKPFGNYLPIEELIAEIQFYS